MNVAGVSWNDGPVSHDSLGCHPVAFRSALPVHGRARGTMVRIKLGLVGIELPGPGKRIFSFHGSDASDRIAIGNVNLRLHYTTPQPRVSAAEARYRGGGIRQVRLGGRGSAAHRC
jgi:hypothetical protein